MNLSPRAVAIACGILLLGAIGLWAGHGFDGLWRWFALGWLAALLIEGQWAKHLPLGAEWLLPAQPRLGQAAEFTLRLSQPGPRPYQMQVFVPPPADVGAPVAVRDVTLSPDTPLSLGQTFIPFVLGPLRFTRATARILGRFGLAWWTRDLAPVAQPLVVVPDTLHADERRAPGALQGEAPLLRRGPGLELLGLRDYRPGDPLRAIAWKASARSTRLMVRDTLQDQHLEIALVLDAGRTSGVQVGALTRLHHCVNVAARFAERCTALGDRVNLVVLGGASVPVLAGLSGADGLRRLRAALARVRTDMQEADPAAAALVVRRLLRQRGLVVWLGDVDTADNRALAQAAQLLAPQHVMLFAQLVDAALLAERDRPARQWLDPYAALAAHELLHQQALAARRLAQLGCDVVSATGPHLERALVDAYLRLRARRRV